MTKRLLPLIPKHKTYAEVFGGGAQLLFSKPVKFSKSEVYNDVDSNLYNFFKILQDDDRFQKLHHKLVYTPYCKEMFHEYRKTWRQEEDIIERVYQWFIIMRQNHSMHVGGRTPTWARTIEKDGSIAKTFKNKVDQLPQVVERWRHVIVDNLDWRECLEKYDKKSTFYYLDPPYVSSTRVDAKYDHELTDDDHEELIDKIQQLDSLVMLSGYRNPIYDKLDWESKDYKSKVYAGVKDGKHPERIETVWFNYQLQPTLF